jgi:hypothetical protein
MAAVEAGPISRMVWDFIRMRVLSVVEKKWLPGVTSGYQGLPKVTVACGKLKVASWGSSLTESASKAWQKY